MEPRAGMLSVPWCRYRSYRFRHRVLWTHVPHRGSLPLGRRRAAIERHECQYMAKKNIVILAIPVWHFRYGTTGGQIWEEVARRGGKTGPELERYQRPAWIPTIFTANGYSGHFRQRLPSPKSTASESLFSRSENPTEPPAELGGPFKNGQNEYADEAL